MTRKERLRSEYMGNYFRVSANNRDLNYDKFFAIRQGQKILIAEYVKEA